MARATVPRFFARPIGLLSAAGVVGVLTIGGVLLTRPDASDVALSDGAVHATVPLGLHATTTAAARPTGTILLPGASVPAVLPAVDDADAGRVEEPATDVPPPAEDPVTTASDPAPPTTGEPAPTTTDPAPPAPPPPTTTSTTPVRLGRILVSDGQLISVLPADGSGRRTVVQGDAPAWHPDGRHFAFRFGGGIWATDVEEPTASRSIVHDGAAPAWSPDGSLLAYVRSVGGRDQVWLVGADGSGARPAVTDPAFPATRAPSWSPDGVGLVFAFGDGASPSSGLAVVAVADPASVTVVADDIPGCCRNTAPAWSPDGRRIAFAFEDVARAGTPRAIRVLDLADRSIVDVIGGAASGPAWAPDGLEVLAQTGTGLVAASPAGGTARPVLTSAALDGGRPSWR